MTSDSRIYAANGDEYVIDDVAVALGDVLAGGGIDNVILYVHGRGCGGGGEPGKSLAEVMPSLESDYDAKALMFNWPGSDVGCPLGFPEAEARAAGPAFAHVLKKLAFWASTHPEALSGVKLTLIPHSMGSFLLEEAMVTDDSPLPGQLFDTVVIQSSATARAGHHAWLASVTFSPNVYVSLNDGDTVLTAASVLGGVRLGKNVDGATLASNAIYVDFTLASVNHAYYLHSGQDGQPMTGFYDTVMNGNAYDFASSTGIASVEARDGTFIYVFEGN